MATAFTSLRRLNARSVDSTSAGLSSTSRMAIGSVILSSGAYPEIARQNVLPGDPQRDGQPLTGAMANPHPDVRTEGVGELGKAGNEGLEGRHRERKLGGAAEGLHGSEGGGEYLAHLAHQSLHREALLQESAAAT